MSESDQESRGLVNAGSIRDAVLNMFEVNFGIQPKEKILVITDIPTKGEWTNALRSDLGEALSRAFVARTVSDIAAETYPDCEVDFYTYASLGRHGAEPGDDVARKLCQYDVVAAITTYSLSHTKARIEACEAGTRLASMPKFYEDFLYPGAIMSADYEQVAVETNKLVKLLSQARQAQVISPDGTDLTVSLEGREGIGDTGILRSKGAFGNLPAGEAYIAPIEGTGSGTLVAKRDWFAGEEDMVLTFEGGLVVSLEGGGSYGDDLNEKLGIGRQGEEFLSRRNVAELGIGTNPFARFSLERRLEAEKIRGTGHIAIGDNSTIGGNVSADLHLDFIIPKVSILLDGKYILRDGEMLV